MALVVTTSTATEIADPTDELKAALKDFEAALLDDQRRAYTANIATPDAESVTLFVADLAAKNQGIHGKFLWKRLCPFLEATRQFTAIVSTFVNSNPATAALVWGGVRTTILAANNVTSYFDQVASLLMEVGRTSPTFAEFGQLYTGHAGLQRTLCGYYTLVIKLCTKILKDSQRNTISHIYSTFFNPFESDFKSFLNGLSASSSEIRDQISLAAKQAAAESSKLLELETQVNKKHRVSASKFWSDTRQEYGNASEWRDKQVALYNAKVRDKIMRNLSQIDYFKAWRLALQPRIPGTAEWFANDRGFQQWRAQPYIAILYVQGTIGAGKTVLAANMVAYLLQQKKAEDLVAFHFCRSDEEASLQARTILGTLARQIWAADLQRMTGSTLDHFYNDVLQASDVDGLTDLLLRQFSNNINYHIVVDGLDECPDTEISLLQQSIFKLCTRHTGVIRFLYSARPHLDTLWSKELRDYGQVRFFKIQLSGSNVHQDINKYIDTALDRCLEDGVLKLNDPTIILRMTEVLKEGSNGMFLWARFFIGELCACLSDHEILEALKQPPHGLVELLNRIILRVKDQKSAEHALRTLEYCGIAKRPLLVEELREALSVTSEQKYLDRRKMPTDMKQIIFACRGLVFVEEVNDTIHYVHHSLKKHLFSRHPGSVSEFHRKSSDIAMGHTCLTYLNFSDFQRQLTKTYANSNMPIQPLQLGFVSTAYSSKTVGKIARKLLSHQSQYQDLTLQELHNITRDMVTGSSRLDKDIELQCHYFLEYARTYWIHHLPELDRDLDSTTWSLFARTMHSDTLPALKPWNDIDQDHYPLVIKTCFPEPLICWAMQNNHAAVLALNREKMETSLGSLPSAGFPFGNIARHFNDLLSWTLARPSLHCVTKTLLDSYFARDFKHSIIAVSADPRNIIVDAVESHNFQGLTHLLRHKLFQDAAVQVLEDNLQSDTTWAVEILLRSGVKLNPHIDAPTELQNVLGAPNKAAGKLINLLLANGAKVSPSNTFPPPLYLAIVHYHGHIEIVQQLIAAHADVNEVYDVMLQDDPDLQYVGRFASDSPLLLASRRGYWHIVNLLLQAGADPNLKAGRGNALIDAASQGHYDVVHRLISAGAAVNSKIDGMTALIASVIGGHLTVVRGLLRHGANVNSKFSYTKHQSSAAGVLLSTVTSLLLEAGPITWRVGSGWPRIRPATEKPLFTPLMVAAVLGFKQVVADLLHSGADANFEDKFTGNTALLVAIAYRRWLVVETLIEGKAQVSYSSATSPPPIVVAVQSVGAGAIRHLISAGADVNHFWNNSVSALGEAIRIEKPDIITILRQAGAIDPSKLPPGTDSKFI